MIGRRRRPVLRSAHAPVVPRIDATGRRVDDLARELVGPLSRRRALGMFGAAAAVAVLRPRGAHGQIHSYPAEDSGSGPMCGSIRCRDYAICCPAPGGPGSCCPADQAHRCDDGGFCQPTGLCPDGRKTCGHTGCCAEGFECRDGQCLGGCPPGKDRCGRECCGRGEKCEKGRCVRCKRGQEACGRTCCAKGRFCCDPDRGVCCDKRTASCCYDGDERGTCCEEPASCAKQIAEIGGAIPAGASRVCCPKDRVVPFSGGVEGCCPAGSVSMGGALIVIPGGGDGGLCCRKQFKCGKTCCANNPYFQQECRSGVCVNV